MRIRLRGGPQDGAAVELDELVRTIIVRSRVRELVQLPDAFGPVEDLYRDVEYRFDGQTDDGVYVYVFEG